MNAARAWLGVHRWRSGLVLLGAGALIAVTAGDVVVTRLASHQVAVGLLAPLVCGLAVPVACAGPGIRVPDPLRAKAARVLWAVLWVGVAAVLLGWVGGMVSGEVATSGALLRNLLLVVALSLWCTAIGQVELCWLPPVVYATCCLQFGGTDTGTARWAAFADHDATTVQLVVAVGLCSASVVLYGALRARP